MSNTISTSTLIPINSDQNGKRTVNARDLHEFLEVETRSNDWIERRIKEYGFEEDQDFVCFTQKRVKPHGGRPVKEYHLTLAMGKELSMVERNEKGKQARQYFIECERKSKQQALPDPMQALNDPAVMRNLLLTFSEKVISLEAEAAITKSKVEFLDRVAKSEGAINVTDSAKCLQMRPKDLFSFMSRKKWIYKRPGGKGWIGYQDKIQQGLLIRKVTTVSTSDGREKTYERVLVAPKGLIQLAGMLNDEAIPSYMIQGGGHT